MNLARNFMKFGHARSLTSAASMTVGKPYYKSRLIAVTMRLSGFYWLWGRISTGMTLTMAKRYSLWL